MITLIKLWCDVCKRDVWHCRNEENLYRCLGCIATGNDKDLCVMVAKRVITVSGG